MFDVDEFRKRKNLLSILDAGVIKKLQSLQIYKLMVSFNDVITKKTLSLV